MRRFGMRANSPIEILPCAAINLISWFIILFMNVVILFAFFAFIYYAIGSLAGIGIVVGVGILMVVALFRNTSEINVLKDMIYTDENSQELNANDLNGLVKAEIEKREKLNIIYSFLAVILPVLAVLAYYVIF